MNPKEYLKKSKEIVERVKYSQNRYREMKLLFLEYYPFCYWCNIPVKDYGRLEDGAPNPNDMATIDHVISKWYRLKGTEVPKVLACFHCNHKRAQSDEKEAINHRRAIRT